MNTRTHFSPSPWSRIACGAALAALLGTAARQIQAVHRERRARTPRALPERLQVWEGEGGQSPLPETAPAR